MNSIVDQRSSIYGDPLANMAGTTRQIEGILTQALANKQMCVCPDGRVCLADWIAPLIMCAVKLNRAASGTPHQDNLQDAENYWAFALQLQARQGALPVGHPQGNEDHRVESGVRRK